MVLKLPLTSAAFTNGWHRKRGLGTGEPGEPATSAPGETRGASYDPPVVAPSCDGMGERLGARRRLLASERQRACAWLRGREGAAYPNELRKPDIEVVVVVSVVSVRVSRADVQRRGDTEHSRVGCRTSRTRRGHHGTTAHATGTRTGGSTRLSDLRVGRPRGEWRGIAKVGALSHTQVTRPRRGFHLPLLQGRRKQSRRRRTTADTTTQKKRQRRHTPAPSSSPWSTSRSGPTLRACVCCLVESNS